MSRATTLEGALSFRLASRGLKSGSSPAPAELPGHLVRRAQGGDRQALGEVLRRYARVLHGLVRRAVPDGDAEELTQALLERLLAVLPQFDLVGPAKLSTWVFTIAHRFLIDEHRRRRLTLVPLQEASGHPDDSEGPHAAAWRGQIRQALEKGIRQLPEEQRRVFVLAHLHEQPLEAVAEAEGIPVGTVKSRLFRARAVLAAQLGPHLGEGAFDAER